MTSNDQTHFGNLIGARPSNLMASSSFMAAFNHAGSLQISPRIWLGVILFAVSWCHVRLPYKPHAFDFSPLILNTSFLDDAWFSPCSNLTSGQFPYLNCRQAIWTTRHVHVRSDDLYQSSYFHQLIGPHRIITSGSSQPAPIYKIDFSFSVIKAIGSLCTIVPLKLPSSRYRNTAALWS